MFPYPLKSNNPVYADGMDAIICHREDKPISARVYPVEDTEDEVLVYRADDPTVGRTYSIQTEDTSIEIDLYDPIVALQVLLRFVAVKGYGTRYYTEKRLRDELLLNDDNALNQRAHLLLGLLAELDVPASPAKKDQQR